MKEERHLRFLERLDGGIFKDIGRKVERRDAERLVFFFCSSVYKMEEDSETLELRMRDIRRRSVT